MIEDDAVYLLQNNWKNIILCFLKMPVADMVSCEGLVLVGWLVWIFRLYVFYLGFLLFFLNLFYPERVKKNKFKKKKSNNKERFKIFRK